MKNLLTRLVREESGQDLIEYALLAAFISLAAIAAMRILATGISGLFTQVSDELSGAGGGD
jgi:pilus assembly protein Flp/PilA